MKELTLRQIEVIRAVMMTGTIKGAAGFLNVSPPGISRLVKYTEESLGIRLFERKSGVFIPSIEASPIFDQMTTVHKNIDSLNLAVKSLIKGVGTGLSFASAPSIAQFIAARAIQNIRSHLPEMFIDLNIVKFEETIDYLLLERGEFVIMSSSTKSEVISNELIAQGSIVAIVPDQHHFSNLKEISVHDLAQEQLIGVDPKDPYGAIINQAFVNENISIKQSIRGRFAQTVVSLVRHGLGVALIDEFSVAEIYLPGITRLKLKENVNINIYVAQKKSRILSAGAKYTIEQFKKELNKATQSHPWED